VTKWKVETREVRGSFGKKKEKIDQDGEGVGKRRRSAGSIKLRKGKKIRGFWS